MVTRLKPAMASDDFLNVNCGRCGRPLRMRVDELPGLRTVECEDGATGQSGREFAVGTS